MKFTITRVLLYLCFITAIYSCTNEREFIENENNIKSKYISFDELKNNSLAFNEYKKTEEKTVQSKNSKLVYNDFYGFYIDTEKILYIEKEEYHSYTFIIKRDIETDKTENLIITLNKDNQYDSKIIRYDFTELDKEKILNNEIVVISKSNAEIINVSNLTAEPCFAIVSVPATINSEGQITASYVSVEEVPCEGASGGGGSSPESGGYSGPTGGDGSGYGGPNSTGYGGNEGNSPNPVNNYPQNQGGGGGSGGNLPDIPNIPPTPIITAPLLILDDEEILDPCHELSELLKPNDSIFTDEFQLQDTIKRPKLKQTLMDVRQYVNAKKEFGYELSYEKAGKKYTKKFVEGSDDAFTIQFDKDQFIYSTIHAHPKGAVKIPSFGDLVLLRNTLKANGLQPYNRNKYAVMVVVKNPNGAIPATLTYALKIENLTTLDTYVESVLNSYGSIPYKEKMDKILDAESIYYDAQPTQLEKLFLDKYGSIGVGLYKADENLTGWGKLTANGTATPTNNPCN